MIPFIRSLNELMVITQPQDKLKKRDKKIIPNLYLGVESQSNTYRNTKDKNQITLPYLPKISRRKWIKSKKIMTEFILNINYKNSMKSFHNSKVLKSQKNYDHSDIA